jgi:glutamate carboxypeptidase
LVFEPALPDGSLVGARKGSQNITAIVRGRAAHAGRDFASGRSATVALAKLITRMHDANQRDVTINCGRISGGGAVNIVPDLAIGWFNIRSATRMAPYDPIEMVRSAAREVEAKLGVSVEIHSAGLGSPPKLIDERSQRLIDLVRACARDVGLGELAVRSSGGASDGNKLAGAGLAVIDTLGPVGGEIHSDREYIQLGTIAQRAKVCALLLTKIANDGF